MTNRNAYNINIPNEVDGKNITEIGPALFTGVDFINSDLENNDLVFFESNLRIKEVNIPAGIKAIYDLRDEYVFGSFIYDINLSEINLPSTLTNIGNYAFGGTNLNNITIPKSVTGIGTFAFFHFTPFESIVFEGAIEGTSQLKIIGDSAFVTGGDLETCKSDIEKTVNIPASVEIIEDTAFGCAHITTLTFLGAVDGTSQLKTIGNLAFANNNITTLTIPPNVETIETNAFRDNPLTSLVFAGTSTNGSGNDTSSLITLGIDYGNIFDVDNVNHIIYLPSSLINMEQHVFGCDYRDSLCTFYINHTSIPETYDSVWAGNYARKYILNGSGGYTCVENCP